MLVSAPCCFISTSLINGFLDYDKELIYDRPKSRQSPEAGALSHRSEAKTDGMQQ
jgi:hypothetical protein